MCTTEFESKMERISQQIEEAYQNNLKLARNASSVLLKTEPPQGGQTYFLIHQSTREPNRWQLTWLDADCQPFGHTQFDTFEQCVASVSGKSVQGPPYGDRSYTVVKSSGNRSNNLG